MDQRNQRVLPSNAPALIECPNIPTSDLDSFESSLVFSPRYDSGRECKAIVGQSILEDDVSARLEAPLSVDSDFEHGSRAGVPSIFPKPPIHSAQADLQRRRHNIRRQRNRSLVKTIWHPWETYSPNYQKYREKQQLKKPGEQKVWPDNVEQAFQDALRLYLKRGRGKEELNGLRIKGKQSGGNEFISDYIERVTGEVRDRKKVSSHIQVLKGKLMGVPQWMFLVTPWPDKKNRPQYHKMQPKVELDIDIPPGPQYAHLLFYNAGPRSPIGLPFNDIGEPTIRQVEFTMKLAAVDERDNVRENLHTFTSIQSETGSAPKCLEQIADWQILFPALASHFDRDHTAAPIFLFSASLSLPKLNGIATSHETKNLSKKLPISLNIDFAQGARYCDWRSVNHYHESSGASSYIEKPLQEKVPWNNVDTLNTSAPVDQKLQVPFNSSFWVELFRNIDRRREEKSAESSALGRPEIIVQEDADIRRYIQELSLTQEIWATPCSGKAQSQCMAILLWTFSQTRNEAPTTSWRRIIASSSDPQMQSLPSPSLETSIKIDTTFQVFQDFNFPYTSHYSSQKDSIFTDHPERILAGSLSDVSSQGSTPHAESTSFVSSTSNSTYPSSVSQQNSFDSQSSGYPSLASFESQRSSFPSHRADIESQNISCGTQDILFGSQESSYASGPLYSLYEHHNLDESTLMGTVEDFTATDLKLSYTDASDSAHDYEIPLLAPRAQTMPQHHFLQLQHYDHLDQNLVHQPDHQENDERAEDESLRDQQDSQQDSMHCSQQDSLLSLEQYDLDGWPDRPWQQGTRPNFPLNDEMFNPDSQAGEMQESGFAQSPPGAHMINGIDERVESVNERIEGRMMLLEQGI